MLHWLPTHGREGIWIFLVLVPLFFWLARFDRLAQSQGQDPSWPFLACIVAYLLGILLAIVLAACLLHHIKPWIRTTTRDQLHFIVPVGLLFGTILAGSVYYVLVFRALRDPDHGEPRNPD